MRKSIIAAAVAALLFATVALAPTTTTAKKPTWVLDESLLPFDALPGATSYWGVRSGAGYRMEVPDNWNGDLVLYAHGFRGDGPDLTVSNPSIRSWFIAEGYAWAASSYSKNGYVPGQGAKDTHALIGEFRGRIGQPDDVFITGHSMGGHITGVAIEQWPQSFAGAVPMCGVMGDTELFDYFQDSYLLAEHFAGKDVAVPTPDDYYDSGEWLGTLATLGMFGPGLTPDGVKYQSAIEQLTGGERPIFDEGWAGPVGGLFPFFFQVAATGDERGNVDTVYQLDNDPALTAEETALNAAIPRKDALPRTRHPNGLGGFPGTSNDSPRINGTFEIPVVSIHTQGELFVPFHMEQIYAERAAANGNADWLVVRAIRDVNHCGFTPGEQIEAFADMVAWAETGVRPAGDDVLNRAAVADSEFGCAFTEFDRPGLPPCGD